MKNMSGLMKQFGQVTQSVVFDLLETKVDPKAWMKAHGFDEFRMSTRDGKKVATVRAQDAFIEGSARRIVIEIGITATVGLPDLTKSFDDEMMGVPTFGPDFQLFQLSNLQIHEVTLTGRPAVGRLADFQLIKSMDTGGDQPKFADKSVPFCKSIDEKRQVFGYVLVPDLPDFQGDIVSAKSVEEAAHSFLKTMSGRRQTGDGIGVEHKAFEGFGHPIESFVDHEGKFGVKGGWVLGTQIVDNGTWEKIKSGEILGYSIGGRGDRQPIEGAQLKAATQEKSAMLNELYAVAFLKSGFSADEARDRAEELNYKVDKTKENDKYLLFIQRESEAFKGDFVECEVFAGVSTVRGELKDSETADKAHTPVPVSSALADDEGAIDQRIAQSVKPLRTVERLETAMPEGEGKVKQILRADRLFAVARRLSTMAVLRKLFEGKTQKSDAPFEVETLIGKDGLIDEAGRKTLAEAYDLEIEVIDAALKTIELADDDIEMATSIVLASLADVGINAMNADANVGKALERVDQLEGELKKSVKRIVELERQVISFSESTPTRKSLGIEGAAQVTEKSTEDKTDWGGPQGMGVPPMTDKEYNAALGS